MEAVILPGCSRKVSSMRSAICGLCRINSVAAMISERLLSIVCELISARGDRATGCDDVPAVGAGVDLEADHVVGIAQRHPGGGGVVEVPPAGGGRHGVGRGDRGAPLALRYPTDVALVGDTKRCLRALMPLLQPHKKDFLQKAQKSKAEWEKLMGERGTRNDKPMKPQVVGWELGKRIPPNAIVTSDSGTITTWWANMFPPYVAKCTAVREILRLWHAGCPMR